MNDAPAIMKKISIWVLLVFLLVSMMVLPAFAVEGDGTEAVGGGTATFPSAGVQESLPVDTQEPAPSQGVVQGGVSAPDPEPSQSTYFGVTQTPEDLMGITEHGIVTTDELGSWFNRKSGEFIDLIKIVGQAALVVVFLVSIVCVAVGAMGNKRLMWGAFIALVVSAVGFTAITCWEQILQVVSLWLRS